MAKTAVPDKPEEPEKPSLLSEVQLFYEAVPPPQYLQSAIKKPAKKSSFKDRRIGRSRK